MGGSHLVEALTQQMIEEAQKYIDEVEQEGGMTKAIEAGIPKMRIEEAAARKQAKIDSGEEFIIGVNSFKSNQKQPEFEILDIDNTEVRRKQIERLEKIKSERNAEKVEEILTEIREAAKNRDKNLLALSIEAARRRVTLGEISDALESNFGRYKANIKTISGVYAMNANKNEYFEKAVRLTQKFEDQEGRRPRIMVAKMGQDGHDRGAKVANLAKAYMGLCYAHLGKYDEAVKALDSFDGDDQMVAPAMKGAMGNCYAQLGQLDKAASMLLKAANEADNNSLSPIYLLQAGEILVKQGKYDDAIQAYTTIKDKYFRSYQAMDIDKYIEQAKLLKK
jgi:tetratricopeptide (TPR) repeat protein